MGTPGQADNEALIELTDAPGPEVWPGISDGLDAYNQAIAGPNRFRLLVIALRDPASGRVIGGLWGRTMFGWLHTHLLYIPGELRGAGFGTRVMRRAETEALARDCGGALVESFSFQARPFYERLGYRVFGTVPGYPPGHDCFFLMKRLSPG